MSGRQYHAARPNVAAGTHTHSVHGNSWSTLGRLLDPLTQDACAFYRVHSTYHEYNGVVYDTRVIVWQLRWGRIRQ